MMMARIAKSAVATVLTVLFANSAAAAAQSSRLDPDQVFARSERTIGHVIGNYTLTDSNGTPLTFGAYRGKPLVISLVYTACSSVCPATTQHLIAAVSEARRVIGADSFEVLTIGFDARNDTPARMAQFAKTQGVTFPNWRLASGEPGMLKALFDDIGFSYTAAAGGFDHITQTTIVDGAGRIYRHVYGDEFPLPIFVEPLKDLIYGSASSFTIGGLIDHIKFICTVYDPGAGRYRIDYGLAFGSVIAALSLFAFGGILLREWRRAQQT